jgi:RsiW-degrading membrane proteinase PrsW (M82 family)
MIARGLLTKVTQANVIAISLIFLLVLLGVFFIPGTSFLLVTVLPLLLSSLIEESIKHLTSIGLMSQDFRFSRSDIIIFTLFVVLGFIFVENILYLYQYHSSITTWIFRSFFSLSAHLLAATICAYAWWKSLSYEPFSISYIAIFSL